MGANRTMKVKGPFRELRNMIGARKKIMCEEQIFDPSIDYIYYTFANFKVNNRLTLGKLP